MSSNLLHTGVWQKILTNHIFFWFLSLANLQNTSLEEVNLKKGEKKVKALLEFLQVGNICGRVKR